MEYPNPQPDKAMSEINLDEIIDANFTNIFSPNQRVMMKSLMKEAIGQALKIAADEASMSHTQGQYILKIIDRVK